MWLKDVGVSVKSHTESSTEIDIKKPKKYVVIMHNDNYSTWEFVIEVLKKVFHKTENEAVEITSNIHNNGVGICGVYPNEIAVMKMHQVHSLAKTNGYPLKCTIEEER